MLETQTQEESQSPQKFQARAQKLWLSTQGQIWRKRKDYEPEQVIQGTTGTKLPFLKIGKRMGFEVERYALYYKHKLFYYETSDSTDYLGYCEIINLYCSFSRAGDRFLIVLTNGDSRAELYFNDQKPFEKIKTLILPDVIQLIFEHEFETLKEIGKGSSSVVSTIRKRNPTYAKSHKSEPQINHQVENTHTPIIQVAKTITKCSENKQQWKLAIKEEKEILSSIDSEAIYHFYECYESEKDFVFVLEYCKGMELQKLSQHLKLSYEDKLHILRQILKGISYLHSMKIIHRDIKPQNMLVNTETMQVKIIDFGMAVRYQADAEEYIRCGTFGFMAPEVMKNSTTHKNSYDYKCDIFSFGIIAHMLLAGDNPLAGKTFQETYCNNREGKIEINEKVLQAEYGRKCVMFIQNLLEKNPQKRHSANEALKAPFLNEKSPSESTQGHDECELLKMKDVDQALEHSKFATVKEFSKMNSLQLSRQELNRIREKRIAFLD